jgi:hypothetical protein
MMCERTDMGVVSEAGKLSLVLAEIDMRLAVIKSEQLRLKEQRVTIVRGKINDRSSK